jgi:hypothetical protein
MFESLDKALSLLEESLQQLDASALERAASRPLFERFCRVERLGAAGKALAARQVADSGAWWDTGERSPAHWMAAVAGTSVGRAVAVLQTAELLESLPDTEAAYRRGDLSEPQVEEIASAAALCPESQQDLLALAELEELVGLRRECQGKGGGTIRARAARLPSPTPISSALYRPGGGLPPLWAVYPRVGCGDPGGAGAV